MSDLKHDLAALRIDRERESSGVGRWLRWTLLLLVLAGAGVAGWRWFTRERPFEVQVAPATARAAGAQAAVLNASGYVTARRRATVSSKITGKVVEVNVEEGMTVREGQVLARLDDSNAKAALALAEAQAESARRAVAENEVRLAEARLTLGRRLQLVKDRVVTQAEVDQAQADVDSYVARIAAVSQQVRVAERQVEVQRTDLESTVIRAPFTGVAISKDAQRRQYDGSGRARAHERAGGDEDAGFLERQDPEARARRVVVHCRGCRRTRSCCGVGHCPAGRPNRRSALRVRASEARPFHRRVSDGRRGVLAGLLPAANAMRIRITDALRRA